MHEFILCLLQRDFCLWIFHLFNLPSLLRCLRSYKNYLKGGGVDGAGLTRSQASSLGLKLILINKWAEFEFSGRKPEPHPGLNIDIYIYMYINEKLIEKPGPLKVGLGLDMLWPGL